MDRAQTSAQLQIIADKLIPEKYKEQISEAIKNYQLVEENSIGYCFPQIWRDGQ